VHDPLADSEEAMAEYGITLSGVDDLKSSQAVILAVPHAQYLGWSIADFGALLDEGAILVDIKSVLDRTELAKAGINFWRV
ncbi:MAG: nucleotide sugar dehydrogenase, partial [Halioglobus sp.]|nr:nucleotide sugar dehydrogenase [Halioglobus sp.]